MLTYLCWHICASTDVIDYLCLNTYARIRVTATCALAHRLYTVYYTTTILLLLHNTHLTLLGATTQASVLQPTCSFNNKTSYISQKCPLCLVMATTRPRDHCAMAARPPTRAANPSSALHVVTWSLGHQPSHDGHHVVWRPLRGRSTPALYGV
jgi:hypothetical protein